MGEFHKEKLVEAMDRQDVSEGKEHLYGFMPQGSTSGFDFSSDDILSNYEYNKKQNFPDAPSRLTNSPTDSYNNSTRSGRFRESRTAKPFANEQTQEDDSCYSNVVGTVERTMKKYADNLLKVLDGMTSRLSQLELVHERLERSVGELRADMAHGHGENAEMFRILENNIREVHRTVQILRDKQEIADAQMELTKLHVARKESSCNLHSSEDKPLASSSVPEIKQEHAYQSQNVQPQHRSSNPTLPALPALPAPPQSSPVTLPMLTHEQYQPSLPQQQQSAQTSLVQQFPVPQQQVPQLLQQPNAMLMHPYYSQQLQQQVPQVPPTAQVPRIQQSPQLAAAGLQAQNLPYSSQPLHIQSILNQGSQPQVQRPQTQQMLQPQPQTQQVQPQPPLQQLHLSQQVQMRPHIYTGQMHGVPPEALAYTPESTNQQTQTPYQEASSVPSEASMYTYGIPPHIIQPSSQGQLTMQAPRPQHSQGGSQTVDSNNASSPLVPHRPGHPIHGYPSYTLPPRPGPSPYNVPYSVGPQGNPFSGAYMRLPSNQQAQAQPYAYPSGNLVPNTSGGHLQSNHAFDELIEQVAGMGFSRDQVRGAIQLLAETGQAVDMNSVLDRLNNTVGPSQRGWYN